MRKSDDPLDEQLAEWQIEPEFRSGFNHEVWRKIAANSSERQEGFWQKLLSSLFVAPRFVTVSTLAIVMLAFSFSTATLAARNANSKFRFLLEHRYAESINPLMRSSMKE